MDIIKLRQLENKSIYVTVFIVLVQISGQWCCGPSELYFAIPWQFLFLINVILNTQ